MKLLTPRQALLGWLWITVALFGGLWVWIGIAKMADLGPQPNLIWILVALPIVAAVFGFLAWWHDHDLKSLLHDEWGAPLTRKGWAHRVANVVMPLVVILAANAALGLVGYGLWWSGHWVLSLPAWVLAGGAMVGLVIAWRMLGTQRMIHGALCVVGACVIFGPVALFLWWLAG